MSSRSSSVRCEKILAAEVFLGLLATALDPLYTFAVLFPGKQLLRAAGKIEQSGIAALKESGIDQFAEPLKAGLGFFGFVVPKLPGKLRRGLRTFRLDQLEDLEIPLVQLDGRPLSFGTEGNNLARIGERTGRIRTLFRIRCHLHVFSFQREEQKLHWP